MRVLFIGTGDIAIPAFDAIAAAPQHDLIGLVTQPDRPAGRKRELKAPEIKKRAASMDIPVLQPEKIRRSEAVEELRVLRPDVGVVMAYGQILPGSVLEIPKHGCLNLHASLLPRHRGAVPIQAALLEGDRTTGITVMYMDEGLDTGDIMLMEQLPIEPGETAGALHDRLGALAGRMIVNALDQLETGAAPRQPQEEPDATYAGKISREDGRIDWRRPAELIERQIRAMDPWPGAFGSFRLANGALRPAKVLRATVISCEGKPIPGERLPSEPGRLIVACGEGALSVTEIQPEGKRPMPIDAFLRGAQVTGATVDDT